MSPGRSFLLGTSLALPLALMLSACGGGGGGGVASIPPPPPTPTPTPTPSTAPPPPGDFPITRTGTYDLSGVLRSTGAATPGDFTMTVSKGSTDQVFAYKLSGPAGFLPSGLTSIDYGSAGSWGTDPYGGAVGGFGKTLPYSADENIRSFLAVDTGYSYVSMGEWGWYLVHLDGGSAASGADLFFVAGDRTPAAGVPASGTATYDAHTFALLSSNLTAGIPFTLTADFGHRTISTEIDQDYRYDPRGDLQDSPAPGIHVSGSAPFSNSGSFDIALTGTANGGGFNEPVTPPLEPVTGSMDGAFYGPHAEQIGGSFSLRNSAGTQVLQDAFVGQQQQPPH